LCVQLRAAKQRVIGRTRLCRSLRHNLRNWEMKTPPGTIALSKVLAKLHEIGAEQGWNVSQAAEAVGEDPLQYDLNTPLTVRGALDAAEKKVLRLAAALVCAGSRHERYVRSLEEAGGLLYYILRAWCRQWLSHDPGFSAKVRGNTTASVAIPGHMCKQVGYGSPWEYARARIFGTAP